MCVVSVCVCLPVLCVFVCVGMYLSDLCVSLCVSVCCVCLCVFVCVVSESGQNYLISFRTSFCTSSVHLLGI